MDEMNIPENKLAAEVGNTETDESASPSLEGEAETKGVSEPIPEYDVSEESDTQADVDYQSLISADLEELKRDFPALKDITDILELDNPLRYAELRDLGLSAREAYLATRKNFRRDNRAHLFGAAPRGAASPSGTLSEKELVSARELFSDMSDKDIQKLYRKVTK